MRVVNGAALISWLSGASGGILPHLSLICSQYTYEGVYKYISPRCGVSHWGAAVQSNSLLFIRRHLPPGPKAAPWRRDAAVLSRPRAPGWIRCELIQRTTQTPLRSYLRSLDEIYRWFRLTGAETSIKTRRLSLNSSLALRRRQPLQELWRVFFLSFFLFSSRHLCLAA